MGEHHPTLEPSFSPRSTRIQELGGSSQPRICWERVCEPGTFQPPGRSPGAVVFSSVLKIKSDPRERNFGTRKTRVFTLALLIYHGIPEPQFAHLQNSCLSDLQTGTDEMFYIKCSRQEAHIN